MIIFTQRYYFNYTIIFRYTTVDKVADDKEKELESQAKKSKLLESSSKGDNKVSGKQIKLKVGDKETEKQQLLLDDDKEKKEAALLAEFESERSSWTNKEAMLTSGFHEIEDIIDGELSFFEFPTMCQADF